MRHAVGGRLALVMAAALLMVWGCHPAKRKDTRPAESAKPAEAPKSEPKSEAKAPQQAPPPAPPPQREPNVEAQDENWKKIAEEAFRKHSLQDQQKIAESGMYYERALAWRDRGDLEKAKEDARKAVDLWPENHEARKLLGELNQVSAGPRTELGARAMADEEVDKWRVKIEQAQIEITNHIRQGERYYAVRQYGDAVREFEEAEFKIKSIPFDLQAMKDILPKVADYLSKARDARAADEANRNETKRREAEAEVEAHELARKREILEKIAHLLELAYMAFDQRKFDRAISLCNEILYIDPHYFVALELKEDAEKSRHREEYYNFLREKIERWKSLTDADDEAVIPYSDTVRFPPPDEWAEISKRIAQATIQTQDGSTEEDPNIVQINNKLESTRLSIDLADARLQDVVDIIVEFTGLNIHIDPGVTAKGVDLEKRIPFKVKDLVLRTLLKLLLGQFGLDYIVTSDQVIVITTPDQAGGRPILELHDIRDILVKIQEFPGPKTELTSAAGGGAALSGATFTLGEEKESSVSEEQILELIKDNIAPGSWDGGEYSMEKTPNQQLLVNHTARTHRELREFLQKLRSYTGTMVGITSRFLAAFDDFLDDVGVDIINRPPVGGYDISGVGFTDVDELADASPGVPGSEVGPGFVTNESARNESYDLRAQTFHSLLQFNPQTGTGVDPTRGRLRNQGGLGLQYQWIGEQALQMVLRAVHKSMKATIVQAPRLTVFNTQRSHIMMLTQTAYIQDLEPQISTLAAAYDPVIGILTQGVVLDVRPIVSNDRKYVTLELRPSLAELQTLRLIDINTGNPNPAQGATVLQLPWIVLQKAETTVTVPDRGTLMISGFKDIVMRDLHSGVPFLENIPVLNFFFTRKGKTNERRRLMILVTPEIIDLNEHEEKRF